MFSCWQLSSPTSLVLFCPTSGQVPTGNSDLPKPHPVCRHFTPVAPPAPTKSHSTLSASFKPAWTYLCLTCSPQDSHVWLIHFLSNSLGVWTVIIPLINWEVVHLLPVLKPQNIFVRNQLTTLIGSIFEFSVLFHWSVSVLLSKLYDIDYHSFISFKNQILLVIQFCSFFQSCHVFLVVLQFHINFRINLSNYKIKCWDFDMDCIKSRDKVWGNCCLNIIEVFQYKNIM